MKFSIAIVTAALLVVALAQEKPKSSLPAETKQDTTKSNPAGTKKSSADVIIVIERAQDATVIVGAARVEIQRG